MGVGDGGVWVGGGGIAAPLYCKQRGPWRRRTSDDTGQVIRRSPLLVAPRAPRVHCGAPGGGHGSYSKSHPKAHDSDRRSPACIGRNGPRLDPGYSQTFARQAAIFIFLVAHDCRRHPASRRRVATGAAGSSAATTAQRGRRHAISQAEPIVMANALPVVQLARPDAHSRLQF